MRHFPPPLHLVALYLHYSFIPVSCRDPLKGALARDFYTSVFFHQMIQPIPLIYILIQGDIQILSYFSHLN